ncbi:hypothetical protein LguiA_029735 [Lonicera macranthoides]
MQITRSTVKLHHLGAQAVGMGVETQKVPADVDMYKKANEILRFDLLDVCINGPKEKLDSTVPSHLDVKEDKEEDGDDDDVD